MVSVRGSSQATVVLLSRLASKRASLLVFCSAVRLRTRVSHSRLEFATLSQVLARFLALFSHPRLFVLFPPQPNSLPPLHRRQCLSNIPPLLLTPPPPPAPLPSWLGTPNAPLDTPKAQPPHRQIHSPSSIHRARPPRPVPPLRPNRRLRRPAPSRRGPPADPLRFPGARLAVSSVHAAGMRAAREGRMGRPGCRAAGR